MVLWLDCCHQVSGERSPPPTLPGPALPSERASGLYFLATLLVVSSWFHRLTVAGEGGFEGRWASQYIMRTGFRMLTPAAQLPHVLSGL